MNHLTLKIGNLATFKVCSLCEAQAMYSAWHEVYSQRGPGFGGGRDMPLVTITGGYSVSPNGRIWKDGVAVDPLA